VPNNFKDSQNQHSLILFLIDSSKKKLTLTVGPNDVILYPQTYPPAKLPTDVILRRAGIIPLPVVITMGGGSPIEPTLPAPRPKRYLDREWIFPVMGLTRAPESEVTVIESFPLKMIITETVEKPVSALNILKLYNDSLDVSKLQIVNDHEVNYSVQPCNIIMRENCFEPVFGLNIISEEEASIEAEKLSIVFSSFLNIDVNKLDIVLPDTTGIQIIIKRKGRQHDYRKWLDWLNI
jgi:hypothetical protein